MEKKNICGLRDRKAQAEGPDPETMKLSAVLYTAA